MADKGNAKAKATAKAGAKSEKKLASKKEAKEGNSITKKAISKTPIRESSENISSITKIGERKTNQAIEKVRGWHSKERPSARLDPHKTANPFASKNKHKT